MAVNYTVYSTRSHTLPTTSVLVIIATVLSFNCMLLAMLLGAGALLSMVVIFIVMGLVFGYFSGSGEYILDEKGIYKNVRPFLFYRFFKYENKSFWAWSDVRSFKAGEDMNRSLEKYQFLEINLPQNTTWQINNQSSQLSFDQFKSEFLKGVKAYNQKAQTSVKQLTSPSSEKEMTNTRGQIIKQKQTFYETPMAKLVFWLLATLFSVLTGFLLLHPQYFNAINLFRLGFVIVPGMIYFYYRLYRKKEG